MENTALGIIDTDRCFYPAEEGIRLAMPGFGELPVAGAEKINPAVNELTDMFVDNDYYIFSTNEAHPTPTVRGVGEARILEGTAHFSVTPSFIDTWPVHGVDGTPGALPHPDLRIAREPEIVDAFIKGDVVAATPEDDTSYTGALAHRRGETTLLPEVLREKRIGHVVLAGLALGSETDPLCVDSTAIDLKEQGFEVTVVTDAVEAVFQENRAKSFANMAKRGIKLATLAEVREMIAAA